MNDFLTVIGHIANVIGVFSFIVVVFLFLQARAQYRNYVKSREQGLGNAPWVLAVGINGSILGQVKPYLDEQGLSDLQVEEYVVEGYLPADRYYHTLRDLLQIKNRLTTAGVTEVLLFYKGPVSLAMGIGSIFDNWVPVKIYEYAGGTYHLSFVLDKETVIGLLGSGPNSSIEDVFKS